MVKVLAPIDVEPARILDTRSGTPFIGGEKPRRLHLPVDCDRAEVKVTVIDPEAIGWVAVYPTAAPNGTSLLNITSRDLVDRSSPTFQPNSVIIGGTQTVPVEGGDIFVHVMLAGDSADQADVLVDLNAVYAIVEVDSETPDPPDPPDPPTQEVIDLIDFKQGNAGERFSKDRVGKGRDVTRYTLTKSTKTQAQALAPATCPFFGQHPGSPTNGTFIETLTLSDYELDMSDVPHNAHGIQVGYVRKLIIERLRARGNRGTTSSPPGETFSLSLWHCLSVLLNDVVLDGTNRSGTRVASTLLGLNAAENVVARKLKATGSQTGFGIACWDSLGLNEFHQPDFSGNRRAINHEQCRGEFRYYEPDCRGAVNGNGNPQVTANGNKGSMKLFIREPKWDRSKGAFRVGVNTGIPEYGGGTGLYLDKPNTQRIEDISVIIDGTEYTGHHNTSLIKIGNYWN